MINNNDIPLNEEEKESIHRIEDEFREGIDKVKDFGPSVTFYGSARLEEDTIPYKKTQALAYRISKELNYTILCGGGGGIMEAANRGAFEAGGQSVGLTIRLPHEQKTNLFVKDEIHFKYFFSRQTSMYYATEVCIFCHGGFGTLSELFEILTLKQTGKIGNVPVILYGSEFWLPLDNFIKNDLLKKYKTISESNLDLYQIVDNEDEIIEIIKNSKMRDGKDSLK